ADRLGDNEARRLALVLIELAHLSQPALAELAERRELLIVAVQELAVGEDGDTVGGEVLLLDQAIAHAEHLVRGPGARDGALVAGEIGAPLLPLDGGAPLRVVLKGDERADLGG